MKAHEKAKQNKKSLRSNFKKSKYSDANKQAFHINELNFPCCKTEMNDM